MSLTNLIYQNDNNNSRYVVSSYSLALSHLYSRARARAQKHAITGV